jgi:hypothetical protein
MEIIGRRKVLRDCSSNVQGSLAEKIIIPTLFFASLATKNTSHNTHAQCPLKISKRGGHEVLYAACKECSSFHKSEASSEYSAFCKPNT